jgi:prenylated cyclic peptide (anacyclamide/piricyclamide family)
MKKKNLQPQVAAPVQRPTAGIVNAQPNGGIGASIPMLILAFPFAGDDAE